MELLFLALAIGCVAFLVKIIMDYLREVPEWDSKVQNAEAERDRHESQMQGIVEAKQGASEAAKTMGEEIKTMEAMRDELKSEIEKTKKEMARKGRIIIPRSKPEA
ncbi:MAG: hypothetical protein O2954_13050 [bacterium]|nr:hypothetical protein [bacterium]